MPDCLIAPHRAIPIINEPQFSGQSTDMKPSASPPHLLVRLTFLAMLALALMVLAGYFGDHSSYLDAFSHFRVHFAIAAGLLGLVLLASRYRLTAACVVVFNGACLFTSPACWDWPGPCKPVRRRLRRGGPSIGCCR
jgi:hypothetical protein